MLFLLFTLGKSRYAIDCAQIVEITPAVHLREMPRAPDFVAGAFQYRGTSIAVLDMRQLVTQERCSSRLSTRIIVIKFKPACGPERLIGLMAEQVTETVRVAPDQVKPGGLNIPAASFPGSPAGHNHQTVQCLQIDRLLRPAVQSAVFRE